MEVLRSRLAPLPPLARALLSHGAALIVVGGLVGLGGLSRAIPGWVPVALEVALAVLLAGWLGLGWGWRFFQVLLPGGVLWQLGNPLPSGFYLGSLVLLALIYGGGVLTRVPLYNSNAVAWQALLDLMPPKTQTFVDLGAGLGGVLAFLAQRRPELRLLGVEASPLVWLWAWWRTRPHRSHCAVHLGSLWSVDLAPFDLVFAFLSPAPMPRLWAKACGEMRPGTLLVSHSFEIPGVEPLRTVPLPGRPGACLRVYAIPD